MLFLCKSRTCGAAALLLAVLTAPACTNGTPPPLYSHWAAATVLSARSKLTNQDLQQAAETCLSSLMKDLWAEAYPADPDFDSERSPHKEESQDTGVTSSNGAILVSADWRQAKHGLSFSDPGGFEGNHYLGQGRDPNDSVLGNEHPPLLRIFDPSDRDANHGTWLALSQGLPKYLYLNADPTHETQYDSLGNKIPDAQVARVVGELRLWMPADSGEAVPLVNAGTRAASSIKLDVISYARCLKERIQSL